MRYVDALFIAVTQDIHQNANYVQEVPRKIQEGSKAVHLAVMHEISENRRRT